MPWRKKKKCKVKTKLNISLGAKILNKITKALKEKKILHQSKVESSSKLTETLTDFSFNPMTFILDSTLDTEENHSIKSIEGKKMKKPKAENKFDCK